MNLHSATPPDGFPRQVIVMDRESASRCRGRGFYLRVGQADGGATNVDLGGEFTLVGAIHAALSKGYQPTHWMETTDVQPRLVPSAIRKA